MAELGAGRSRWLLPAVLVFVLAVAPGRAHAQSGNGTVVAFPGPGWGYASPDTTITLQGATAGRLEGMRVSGSASGDHPGAVRPLRVGTGAVFVPDHPFTPNEQVTVELPVPVRGADGTSYTFRVADPSLADPPQPPVAGKGPLVAVARNRACQLEERRLVTLPAHRPVATCARRRGGGSPLRGRILVSPRPRDGATDRDPALMILSNTGRLFWHSPQRSVVHDLKLVELDGRPHLAYYVRQAVEPSYYEIINQHYEVVTRVFAGNGYRVNGHEMQVTPQGTAYIAVYRRVRDPDSGVRVTDFIVQEIDLTTRDVLFEWHSLDHVPVSASYDPRPTDGSAWDYFHGNSIEPPPGREGTIVVSARKTSAVYGIDRVTGDLSWILGGKQDQFGLVGRNPRWQFCAQHDARWLPNGDLSIFDNGGFNLGDMQACPAHTSRVLRFDIDPARMKARVVRRISSWPSSDDGFGFRPTAVGSARMLAGGDTLVSWGTTGRITQVSPRGRVKLRMQLERWTYRATRAPWTGLPRGRPAAAARRRGSRAVDVYASWNGATQIRRWRVLAGETPETLAPIASPFPFADLETRMRVRTRAPFVAVEALDGDGEVLGRSAAKPVLRPTPGA